MAEDKLVWLIGAFLCFVIVIAAVIPTAITASAHFNSQGTQTGELFTGTAAVAQSMAYSPIVSLTAFKKAAYINTVNVTPLVGANGVMTIPIDSYAAHGGVAWEGVNITINNTGANATTNWTWVAGTCNAANKTIASDATQTWTAIASTCLTPGGTLTLTFVNTTTAGEVAPTITGIGIKYFRYVDNTAYTLASASGQITPTASGYYYATYTYGTGVTGGTLALVLVLPLLIAVALLMIFLRTSGMF